MRLRSSLIALPRGDQLRALVDKREGAGTTRGRSTPAKAKKRARPRQDRPAAGPAGKAEGTHHANFKIKVGRGAKADRVVAAVRAALGPELAEPAGGPRVRLVKSPDAAQLEIEISAPSLSALRAAVNSHLRAATLALQVAELAASRGEEE